MVSGLAHPTRFERVGRAPRNDGSGDVKEFDSRKRGEVRSDDLQLFRHIAGRHRGLPNGEDFEIALQVPL